MRGLKHGNYQGIIQFLSVASFTDAWIETVDNEKKGLERASRILYGCVD